jgi:hypothetical protein
MHEIESMQSNLHIVEADEYEQSLIAVNDELKANGSLARMPLLRGRVEKIKVKLVELYKQANRKLPEAQVIDMVDEVVSILVPNLSSSSAR